MRSVFSLCYVENRHIRSRTEARRTMGENIVARTEDGTLEIKKIIGFYTQLGTFILRLQDFVVCIYIYTYYSFNIWYH